MKEQNNAPIQEPVKEESPRQIVLRMVWPVFTEVLLGALFGMVDMMMVGKIPDHSASSAAVAAVGLTNQPLLIGLALIQALNVGGTAMIARYYGAGKKDQMGLVFKHVAILAIFCVALPMSAIMISLAPQILGLLGAGPDVVRVGTPYFQIVLIGFLFQAFSFSVTAALRGVGETKIPMKNNLIANTVNICGNSFLIYGWFGLPALGIVGAGIATVSGNLVAAILNITYLLSGRSVLKVDFRSRFRFDKRIMGNLVKIGFPSACEQLALRFGVIAFLRIVTSLGTNILAAHQIALNILSLSFSPGQAFGITASALVGRALGAKQPSLAETYAKICGRMGVMVSTTMGLVFFFFGANLAALYSDVPEIIAATTTALSIIAFIQPFQGHQLITAGALRGAGDTVWPLVSTFSGILLIRVTFGYIFVTIFKLGIAGAWYAVFIDQFLRWLMIFFRFRSGKWKHIKIR